MAKIITLLDENKALLNEANRRINEIRRSKWKTTPALDVSMPTIKKVGTKTGRFSVAKKQDEDQLGAAVAEAKRFIKADTSTVEGYEKIMNEREQRFRDRYGEWWGTTDLSRKQFFNAISSKWYHRLHDMGVNSELLIKYATVVSENTTSSDPQAAKRAFKRLYEKVIFEDLEKDTGTAGSEGWSSSIKGEAWYASQLIDKRTKIMTGRAGKKASIYDVYTQWWYDGGEVDGEIEI